VTCDIPSSVVKLAWSNVHSDKLVDLAAMSNEAHHQEHAQANVDIKPRQQQSSTSAIQIPATAPAGGLTITQPPQTATSFYKIAPSQFITFAWNFTYVLVTPTSLTLSAVGDNGNTYPVGPTNGVIAGTSTSVVWDPWTYNQNTGGRVSSFYIFTSFTPASCKRVNIYLCIPADPRHGNVHPENMGRPRQRRTQSSRVFTAK
jgi:hypothetical protein